MTARHRQLEQAQSARTSVRTQAQEALGTYINPWDKRTSWVLGRGSRDLWTQCSEVWRSLRTFPASEALPLKSLLRNLAKSEQNPIRPLTGSMITRALPPIPSQTPRGQQTLHPEQMTEKKRVGKSRLSASQRTGLRGGSVFSLHKHINHN